ncbi:MAG: hypothetical protein M3Q39_01570 [Actinomycetota bacterium]|nr:hypothetical protein [Actinomycetota bacterium]
MNRLEEDLKKKSALRSATGNPLGPQPPPSRLPPYTTPAVLDGQRQAEVAGRQAAAAQAQRAAAAAPRPVVPSGAPTIDRAGNVFLNSGDQAGFQNNTRPQIDPRAGIDAIKAQNAARESALRGVRPVAPPIAPINPDPLGQNPQMRGGAAPGPTTAPAEPVKPVRGVAGEAPAAKPGIGAKIKAGLGMGPKVEAAPKGILQPKGLGAKVIAGGLRTLGPAYVAGTAIAGAGESYDTPTSTYEKRLGMERLPGQAQGTPFAEFGRDLGIRALGVGGDLIDNLLPGDQFGRAAERGAIAPVAALPGTAAPTALEPLGPRPAYVSPYAKGIPGEEAIVPAGGASTGDPNEVIGVFNGKQITRGMSDQLAGAQSFGGSTTSESALRRPDLNRMGSGFAQTPSRSSAINSQFDGIAKQIQDLHGSAKFGAKGSLATKLLRLEEARAQALGQDQGALVNSQGNQVSDLNNKRTNEAGLFNTETDERSALRREKGEDARARVSASTEALKLRQQQSEAAIKQVTEEAGRLFPEDPQGQQAYIDSQNRRLEGLISGDLSVGEVAGITAQDRPYVSVRDKANANGRESDRDFMPTGEGPSRMTYGEAVEGTFGDGAGGLGKYIRDQTVGRLPFTDTGAVIRGEDGRMVNWEDLSPDERAALIARQRKGG